MAMEQWLNTSDLIRTFEYARVAGDTFPRILFVCPRQSGKTTALFDTFLDTPDSIFMTTIGSTLRELRIKASRMNRRGDNLRPMYDVLTLSSGNSLRGRMRTFSTIFIDDVDRYMGDWEEFLSGAYPVMHRTDSVRRGIVATMTPNGRRNAEFYDTYFNYIRRPLTGDNETRRSDFDRDHFNNEDFTI